MTFFSILCALLIEQLKPLRADNQVYGGVKSLAVRIETWFNAGEQKNGRMGWILMMTALMLPTWLVYWFFMHYNLVFLAFAWNVLIVYLTLGFRHYSHYFTSIQFALNAGDDARARTLLAEWTRLDTVGMDSTEITRIAVEKALITTHRNVFGVFFWFLMPLGPAGAVMYRVSEYLSRAWNEPDHMRNEAFGQFAARAFYWIDWAPVRLTAVAFGTPNENAPQLLPADAATVDLSESDVDVLPGEEPNVRALQSTVGLVWRALILWMILLLLTSSVAWLR